MICTPPHENAWTLIAWKDAMDQNLKNFSTCGDTTLFCLHAITVPFPPGLIPQNAIMSLLYVCDNNLF